MSNMYQLFKLRHLILSSGRWGRWLAEGRRRCSQQDPALCPQEDLRPIARWGSGRIQDRPCVEGLDSLNATYIEGHVTVCIIPSNRTTIHTMSCLTPQIGYVLQCVSCLLIQWRMSIMPLLAGQGEGFHDHQQHRAPRRNVCHDDQRCEQEGFMTCRIRWDIALLTRHHTISRI